MEIHRLSILGVGLLGGSLGLALKRNLNAFSVVGYGHRALTLDRALEMGAIDQATQDLSHAVREADCVVLCTPVGLFEQLMVEMGPSLKPGAIVTDVGSTKRSVVSLAERLLPEGVHFIGSHPMAGSEKRGVEFARADLFEGSTCITTPLSSSDAHAIEAVEGLWRSLGMNVIRLTPEEHDRGVAMISHLPHALAAALVAIQDEQTLTLAGKGFLDATRIAAGDGAIWRDIFLDNADAVRTALGKLIQELDQFAGLLKPEKHAELKAWLDKIAGQRKGMQ